MSVLSQIQQILHLPRNAWRYSRKYPLEAFCYAGAVLLAAWLARLFLSIVALTLMFGALHAIIYDPKER